MGTPEGNGRGGRETRLLLVTIAVSVGVLLLLARFRFPDAIEDQPVDSAPAPLEVLAARTAFDELGSIMADLERRVAPRVTVLRTRTRDGRASLVLAPRLTPDRAVALLRPDEAVDVADSEGQYEIISRDSTRGVAVVRVPAVDDSAVTVRQGAPRPGPRYVGVVEATPAGPALRPVYVGRIDSFQDPQTRMQLLSLSGVQHALPHGTAVFSLEGGFIGLVRDAGGITALVSAESLRVAAESAQQSPAQPGGHLGIEAEALTAAMTRATGTDQGVVVVRVHPSGPADGVLHAGDVIQTVDGRPVSSLAGFRELEHSCSPRTAVAITGIRRRSPLQVAITAGDATVSEPPSDADPGFVGRFVADAGIEVVSVDGGAAVRAGLQRGDLVTTVDGERARDGAALATRFRAAAPGTAILVTIQRGQQHRILVLEKR
jgi:hypothetical protein